jgi:hypothetical protein
MRSVPLLVALAATLAFAPAASAEEPFSVARSAAAHPTPLVSGADRARQQRLNDRANVPAEVVREFLPLYRRAAEHFGVHWILLAAIHKQETAFSTAEGTYRGLNWLGCCGGPMQFNVTNGPKSTWEQFRDSYADEGLERPRDYPHQTRRHPSLYDDWDAITAAAALLKANGATEELNAQGSWSAAYLYYGPGSLVEGEDYGIVYANEVLARALHWARRGFRPDAATPRGLVKAVAASYQPADPRAEAREKRKRKRAEARRRRKVRERELRERRRRARAERERRADRAERRREQKDADVRRDRERKQPSGRDAQPQGDQQGGRRPDADRQPGGVGAGDGGVLPDGGGGPPVHGAAPGEGSGAAPAGGATEADPRGPAQPPAAGAGAPAG